MVGSIQFVESFAKLGDQAGDFAGFNQRDAMRCYAPQIAVDSWKAPNPYTHSLRLTFSAGADGHSRRFVYTGQTSSNKINL